MFGDIAEGGSSDKHIQDFKSGYLGVHFRLCKLTGKHNLDKIHNVCQISLTTNTNQH